MSLLVINNLYKYFGGLAALNGFDLTVNEHEILGIIGPNGAGKSTLFNVVTGCLPPSSGKILYFSRDITGCASHRIAKYGISRTFQLSSLFARTSVFDCVYTAFHHRYQARWWQTLLNTPKAKGEEAEIRKKVAQILEFLELEPHQDKLAEELSSGYKRALAIGIAIAAEPKLLLLDEPVTTLSEDRVARIMEMLVKLRAQGTTIVIIEHNMKAIMEYCDRIVVLAEGKKLAEGTATEIRENAQVIEAYLGEMV